MWENQQDDRDDDKIMRQEQQIAINEAIGMQRKGQPDLLDDALHADESAAAFRYHASDEHPKDQADREHRQIVVELGMEQLRIDQPHSANHHRGRQGLPKGAQYRTPIP